MSAAQSSQPAEQGTKTALITGAGQGVGRHLAERLAAEGYQITAADIKYDRVESLVRELEGAGGVAQAVRCDVTSYKDQQAMFDKHIEAYKHLDVAFLNAGLLERGGLISPGESNADQVIDVVLKGMIYGVQLATQHMEGKGGGKILLTASITGLRPYPPYAVYSAAKAGVLNYMRTIAPALKERSIHINAVCPGVIHTGMLFADGDMSKERVEHLKDVRDVDMVPMSWVGDAFFMLLNDPDANGQMLRVEPNPNKIEEVGLEEKLLRGIKKQLGRHQ